MLKKISAIFILLYAPILLLSLYLVYQQKEEQLEIYTIGQTKHAINKSYYFTNQINSLVRDVNYWSKINYPTNFQPLEKDSSFIKPYFEIIKGITNYDQFRFIDLNGKELFRVEQKGNDFLELGQLQKKKNRKYVIDGLQLKRGQVYLSPIELNKENGKIEKPYKPVLRAVAPIFDSNENHLGIVVINFRMNHLLTDIKYRVINNNISLLDSENKIITSTLYDEDLPFEVPTKNKTFEKAVYAQNLDMDKDTSIFLNGSIWTVQKIDLNSLISGKRTNSNETVQIISPTNWKLLMETPKELLSAILSTFYKSIYTFNIIAFLTLLGIAYIFQKNRVQKENHYQEIEIKNLLLSKRTNELQENNKHIESINHRLETRNKQLSEFNYLVSHNLRAPVTSMSVIVELIKNEKDPRNIFHLLPKLEKITDSITELTNDIGEYISLLDEKGVELEEINLEKLIHQVKNEFSEMLLENSNFEVKLKLDAWKHVLFSKFHLQSILQNFISNAIKYRKNDTTSYIQFETQLENNHKILYVKDNGIGIDLKKHGKSIFKLYKRFHRNISGKGIGLFLIKSQLEALDASISISSEKGVGTTFKINFNTYDKI